MVILYISLVLSISVTDVQTTPLLVFKELLSADSPKYWFHYIRKFLHQNINLTLEYYKKQTYFDFHFINFKRIQIFKRLATDVIQYDRKCNKTWEKIKVPKVESVLFLSTPIRSIIDNINITCRGRQRPNHNRIPHVEFNNKWIFTLHKLYRLNISFEHLHFYLSSYSSRDIGNMTINSVTTSDKFNIKYCGVHSAMSIFPPHSNVTIDILTTYATIFSVILSYSIIDPNNVITISHDHAIINKWTHYYDHDIENKWEWHFIKRHINLQIFMLVVKRYQYLVIHFTVCNNCSVKVHDGPDFLSPSLRPVAVHANRIGDHLENYEVYSTLFQCVLYIFPSNTSLSNEILKYSSSNLLLNKTFFISPFTNMSVFTFPNSHICRHRNPCLIHFQTDEGYRFNVTMRSIFNSNQGDILCTYAGLSMYDNDQDWRELSKICTQSERNVYSLASGIFLVLYSYREYGSFSVELEFSTTRCNVVEMNYCWGYYVYPPLKNSPFKKPKIIRKPTKYLYFDKKYFEIFNIGCTVYQTYATFSHDINSYHQTRWKGIEGGMYCDGYVGPLMMLLNQLVGKTADNYIKGFLTGKVPMKREGYIRNMLGNCCHKSFCMYT